MLPLLAFYQQPASFCTLCLSLSLRLLLWLLDLLTAALRVVHFYSPHRFRVPDEDTRVLTFEPIKRIYCLEPFHKGKSLAG